MYNFNNNKYPFIFVVPTVDDRYIKDIVYNRLSEADGIDNDEDKVAMLRDIVIDNMYRAFDLGHRLGKTES